MDQGSEGLQNDIQEIRRIVERNNAMLISIQRRARMSILFTTLKWVIIIGLSFGAFYFLKPYVDTATSTYSGLLDQFKQ
ncbi:MAG: hypothetical protein RJB39_634 [Candidatus Parcubacteria bacterium]|jgi:hypothetical protein